MNLLLMRAGYPVVIIRRRDRQRYYEALSTSDDGDLGPLLELITERLQDSLQQIDRIRSATAGISFALEKIRAAEERQFRLWSEGVQLLVTAIEDSALSVMEADPSFAVEVTRYTEPDLDQWRMLRSRQITGNAWLLRVRVRRQTRMRQVLFWTGFSSEPMLAHLKIKDTAIPTIWISEHRPGEHPAWGPPEEAFPTKVREIAFHEGRFFVRFHNDDVHPKGSVIELASNLITSLLGGWFSPDAG